MNGFVFTPKHKIHPAFKVARGTIPVPSPTHTFIPGTSSSPAACPTPPDRSGSPLGPSPRPRRLRGGSAPPARPYLLPTNHYKLRTTALDLPEGRGEQRGGSPGPLFLLAADFGAPRPRSSRARCAAAELCGGSRLPPAPLLPPSHRSACPKAAPGLCTPSPGSHRLPEEGPDPAAVGSCFFPRPVALPPAPPGRGSASTSSISSRTSAALGPICGSTFRAAPLQTLPHRHGPPLPVSRRRLVPPAPGGAPCSLQGGSSAFTFYFFFPQHSRKWFKIA